MRSFYLILTMLLLGMPLQAVTEKKVEIPKDEKWDKNDERDNSSPKLYKDDFNVYVYSEKQLDNLTIGITDMQGNLYHQEVTTVPAGMYYAISIESFPAGTYYISVIQGSSYVIGTFQK